ncbi:DUF58 domain-containing protein [Paenibacillus brevis]|uniref:DUF58 domain-containing protein n=1 Tax=Paenibacillus brevis TaxID=2841508 RepID=A0ABS6FQ14_9BACL|nr:DUF58 domain-containing protein [Paenibacillus brevis]MBU5672324.1 DUF58 domain-containing protein [Paenibacillus brevis]
MRTVMGAVRAELSSFNFWKMASLWIICLLYVLFQGGKTSLMLLAMTLVLSCYWIIGGWGGIRRTQGSRSLSVDGERPVLLKAGDAVQIRLEVQTPRFLPLPYIVLKEHLHRHNGEAWVFQESIIPRMQKNSTLAYQTPPLERGRYSFEDTECYSEDIFGWMKHKSSFMAGGEFRILPRTVFIPYWQLQSRNSRLAGTETAVSMSRRETTQINGVRDYVYGDRISRIHWNATAKTGTWKSKEFEHESLPKTFLVLDGHSIGYMKPEQFELAVSTAASLLEFGARQRINMGLCTLGKEIRGFAPSEGHLERLEMLHHLVDIHADGYGSHIQKLDKARILQSPGAFFILISPLSDENLFSILRWAKSHHMTPYHIHIAANTTGSARKSLVKSMLQERGIRGISVSSLAELPAALGGGIQ